MIMLYQTIIVLALVGVGYLVFTRYMIKSKLSIINEELETKKVILSQLIEANAELQIQLNALEKKSKLNEDEISDIYAEIKEKKDDNENTSIDDRINRLRNSG